MYLVAKEKKMFFEFYFSINPSIALLCIAMRT